MWVRFEVMGHIRILARPHTVVRVLQASLWLLDPIFADESLHPGRMLNFPNMMFLTRHCYNRNCKVRMSIACRSLVHRLGLPRAAQPLFVPLQIPTQAEYRDVEPHDITAVGAERQTLHLIL